MFRNATSPPTTSAAAFVLVTHPLDANYAFGILYSDGVLLSVNANLDSQTPLVRSSTQVAALGLRLTRIAIDTTIYPAPATGRSNFVAPCSIVYPNTPQIPAILFASSGLCFYRLGFDGGALWRGDTVSYLVKNGANIRSRRGINGIGWGDTTTTGFSPFTG
jgi:hypothetical protein